MIISDEQFKKIDGEVRNWSQEQKQQEILLSQQPQQTRQNIFQPPELLKQFGIVVIKGVGQTARQLGSVAPTLGAKIAGAVTGKEQKPFEPISKELVTPQGMAQKVGYKAEK